METTYGTAKVRRLLMNICVIGVPLTTSLLAVADKLPPWLAIAVTVAAVTVKQIQSTLDLKAPGK